MNLNIKSKLKPVGAIGYSCKLVRQAVGQRCNSSTETLRMNRYPTPGDAESKNMDMVTVLEVIHGISTPRIALKESFTYFQSGPGMIYHRQD